MLPPRPGTRLPKPFEFCHDIVFHTAVLRQALIVAAICVTAACTQVEVRKPPPLEPQPGAGQLTLTNGRTVWVHPDELSLTGTAHFRWPDGKTYEGAWRAGLPHGTGSMELPGGERYSGAWDAGRRHGRGELWLTDGSHYVGEFVNDKRQGEGASRSPEGVYRGTWHDDLPHGQGDYLAADGSIYQGQWHAGQRHGSGRYQDQDGSIYEGDWALDQPHGFGTLTTTNGARYEGRWQAGKRGGYGSERQPSGLRYEGTWVADTQQGYGLVRRPDGSSYEGEWLNGKRHGQGSETWPDGSSHDGTWENNQALGPGQRRDASGISISGLWNGDHVSTGLLALPTGEQYAGPLFSQLNTRVSAALQAWLHDLAERGDPYAQLLLGRLYTDFLDPPADPQRARQHLAQSNVPEAKYRLALLERHRQLSRAVALLAEAAELDHAAANTALGTWYMDGQTLPHDPQMAERYLTRAVALGDPVARQRLAALLVQDTTLADPERAIEMLAELAHYWQDWQDLSVLAAAQAAMGDYRGAATHQHLAIEQGRRGACRGRNSW